MRKLFAKLDKNQPRSIWGIEIYLPSVAEAHTTYNTRPTLQDTQIKIPAVIFRERYISEDQNKGNQIVRLSRNLAYKAVVSAALGLVDPCIPMTSNAIFHQSRHKRGSKMVTKF